MAAVTEPLTVATRQIELNIGGMTCASCAGRIEKKLNRLDGVVATVNYATKKATVTFPKTLSPADLIATVENTGYTAALPAEPRADKEPDELAPLRTRLLISIVLAVPVIAMAMIRPLQFPNWQ